MVATDILAKIIESIDPLLWEKIHPHVPKLAEWLESISRGF